MLIGRSGRWQRCCRRQSQAALQNWLNAKLEQVSQQESVVRYVTTLLNRFLSEQTLGEAFDGS